MLFLVVSQQAVQWAFQAMLYGQRRERCASRDKPRFFRHQNARRRRISQLSNFLTDEVLAQIAFITLNSDN